MKKSLISILHLGYWFSLLTLAFIILAAASQGFRTGPPVHEQIIIASGFVIPGILAFYGSYLFLFHRFFPKRKWLQLILGLVGMAFGSSLIGGTYLSAIIRWDIFFIDGTEQFFGQLMMFMGIAGLNGVTGLVVRGFTEWFQEQKLREELLQKQHQTELALVKAQLDPHFLFNTLNNIDTLIGKDPERASEYLQGLSHILRFMLFEAKSDQIPLQKEIDYLKNYIELQRIRTSNADYVKFEVVGDPTQFQISPMLFLPFVENAFKHASNKKAKDSIGIRLEVGERGLHFQCRNRSEGNQAGVRLREGLGEALIQRRLELTYPGQHELKIREEDGFYLVDLNIARNAA